MKKEYRKALFISSVFIFFIIAPILIFHSQGYRFDFKNKKVIQTGGFYFEILPKQSNIYLNNKLSTKTNFLFNSTLIENILPDKYDVRIEKNNYRPWEKILNIKEKEVTEAKNIVLFPKNFNFFIVSKKIKDFWVSPSEEKIIWKEVKDNTWSLKLYDLKKELKSHLISEKEISRNKVDLIGLTYSQDGKKIFIETIASEQLKVYSIDINEGSVSLKETKKPKIKDSIITYQDYNGENYYIDNKGDLYKTNQNLNSAVINNSEKLNDVSFPIKKETPYKLYVFRNFIFLREERNAYLLDQKTKKFNLFAKNVTNLKISPDKKTIVYSSGGEAWILPIEKTKL